jgi:hypothetical protein
MNASWLDEMVAWADATFKGSELPDRRLRRRLVRYAAKQAQMPEASTAKACEGSKAEREGAYRFLENERVSASGIDEGPYRACAATCRGRARLLAIQDSTSVQVHQNALAELLEEQGGPKGFMAHTLMMVCGETGMPLGIADQQRWVRSKERPGKSTRRQRDYEDKESFKWQQSLERARLRVEAEQMISVCDREADIYEFLSYHVVHGVDFVIRASWNRRTTDEVGYVLDVARQAPVVGNRTIRVEQRGGQRARNGQPKREARRRREVPTQLQAARVVVRPPKHRADQAAIEINVVRVAEVEPPDGSEALEWVLLTSLPIDMEASVKQVVQDYERRWLIEQFHKCWKTGCRLETRPFHSTEALERMLAIMAPVGLRILQVQCAAAQPELSEQPAPLDDDEWRCLWVSTSKDPLPRERPSAQWAYSALAKLGGFYDSKGTGRAGWQTLWGGWLRLQERLLGWHAAQRARAKI